MTGPLGGAWRPTRAQLAAAEGAPVPDVIAAGLRVLFVGINPGLYSGAVDHHFARPGNRFWKVLHGAGFTDRMLSPFEDSTLVERGIGITNLVERSTARADALSAREMIEGVRAIRRKTCRYRPAFVAFLGITSYQTAFGQPHAGVGALGQSLCRSRVWVLPNRSGLNAHYQVDRLVTAFAELRRVAFSGGEELTSSRRSGS